MKISEYAKQLSELPSHYLALESHEIRTCLYGNSLVVAHKDHAPLHYTNGRWNDIAPESLEETPPSNE